MPWRNRRSRICPARSRRAGFVSVGDIPPKLRIAWTMASLQRRKMFLLSELAYYLRGPAMMEAALRAREAKMEKRSEAEREGATV